MNFLTQNIPTGTMWIGKFRTVLVYRFSVTRYFETEAFYLFIFIFFIGLTTINCFVGTKNQSGFSECIGALEAIFPVAIVSQDRHITNKKYDCNELFNENNCTERLKILKRCTNWG